MFVHDLSKVMNWLERSAAFFGLNVIISGHRNCITIHRSFPKDMNSDFKPIYDVCRKYTMTSIERMYALYEAINYITKSKIPGDIAICGVWKGGSAMVAAMALLAGKDESRKLYLYDTFKGMSQPTDKDRRLSDDKPVMQTWQRQQRKNHNDYAYAPLAEVRHNMLKTHYPPEKIYYIAGKVEDTLPVQSPDKLSLLRLDTDWYESTYHELCHLYPKLVLNGVLIIDDYGHFAGAREAADQYFREQNLPVFLERIDYTGRLVIKTRP